MLNKKALSAARIASGAVTDPDFEYVTMLLHGDGTNGAQNNSFTDGSANNFTVTRNGNPTQGTFSPFAPGWSNYFDGTGDYLSIADNANLRLGSGTFTMEAWVYRNASGAAHTIFAKGGASTGIVFQIASTNVLRFTDTTTNIDSTGTIAANTWVHVAVVREGTGTNQTKLYINGTQDGQGTVSTDFTQTEEVRIGTDRSLGADFNGYISNLRMIKGTAQYTGNFTVPTSALTAVTNTQLLTCQSNRFRDNSSNGFTITRNGDVRVQPFNPFSPAAAYSTGTNGGSGYFDGSGDYLTVPANAAFEFGSGNFTIECWIRSTQTSGSFPAFLSSDRTAGQTEGTWTFGNRFNSVNRVFFYWQSTTYGGLDLVFPTTNNPNDGAWHHVAVVRSGTDLYGFFDGTLVTSTTINAARTLGPSGRSVWVGDFLESSTHYYYEGYISDVRILKGTAQYTAGFTPPTAPLTAITNTSLLLNCTNGAIIDNAMDNVLETVGNAQISTSVKKFGTGSLSFDGTGDYLQAPYTPDLDLSNGDWTVEGWVRFAGTAEYNIVSINSSTSTFAQCRVQAISGGTWRLLVANSSANGWVSTTTGGSWTTGTWYHFAAVRNGSNYNLYIDGTSVNSFTSSTSIGLPGSSVTRVGSSVGASSDLNGYVDDLRITKGKARYTANFTPPTAAFPDL